MYEFCPTMGLFHFETNPKVGDFFEIPNDSRHSLGMGSRNSFLPVHGKRFKYLKLSSQGDYTIYI